jgi:hypothetical protein
VQQRARRHGIAGFYGNLGIDGSKKDEALEDRLAGLLE